MCALFDSEFVAAVIADCQSVDGSILSGAAVFAAKSKDAGHQSASNLL
jgi:hypothetical protein